MLRLAVLLALAASVPATGEDVVRCAPDPDVDLRVVGQDAELPARAAGDDGVTCRSSDGAAVPARRSGVGTLTVRDADGGAVYGHTDAAGVTTFRTDRAAPLRPPSFTTSPDGAGGTIFRDDAGNTYNPPTDETGTSTFHTSDGRITRCHTVGSGHAVCD